MSKTILGLKEFGSIIILGPTGPTKFLVHKNVGPKNLVTKWFGSRIIFGLKGSKTYGSTNCGSKNSMGKEIFGSKILV